MGKPMGGGFQPRATNAALPSAPRAPSVSTQGNPLAALFGGAGGGGASGMNALDRYDMTMGMLERGLSSSRDAGPAAAFLAPIAAAVIGKRAGRMRDEAIGAANRDAMSALSTMQPLGGGTSPMDAYAYAIKVNESGGNYQALGPVTKNGDRAYGAYQVMGANVGPWTEKWWGTRLTPEQFLANQAAQDAVFNGEFGSYINRFGNPQDAASAWFSGRPLAGNTSSDGYATVPEYVEKFNNTLRANVDRFGAGPQYSQAQIAQMLGYAQNELVDPALRRMFTTMATRALTPPAPPRPYVPARAPRTSGNSYEGVATMRQVREAASELRKARDELIEAHKAREFEDPEWQPMTNAEAEALLRQDPLYAPLFELLEQAAATGGGSPAANPAPDGATSDEPPPPPPPPPGFTEQF